MFFFDFSLLLSGEKRSCPLSYFPTFLPTTAMTSINTRSNSSKPQSGIYSKKEYGQAFFSVLFAKGTGFFCIFAEKTSTLQSTNNSNNRFSI